MLSFRIRAEWKRKARTTQETNPNFQQFLEPAGQDWTEHNGDSLPHTLKEQGVTINENSSLDQCRGALTSSSTQHLQDECDQNFEKNRHSRIEPANDTRNSSTTRTLYTSKNEESEAAPENECRRTVLFTTNYTTTNHTVSTLDRETSSASRNLRFNLLSKLHPLHASRKTYRHGEQRHTKKGGLPILCRPPQNRILTN